MTNRITSLEAQVSELEATVHALTADLVEVKSRLNELEGEPTTAEPTAEPPSASSSASRGAMAFSPEDDAAIVDQFTGVMGQPPTPPADDGETSPDEEHDGDIVIA
ncbi:MAG: hypothetical protein RI531_00325 [Haloferacaceae archaeon]|nr:hypothetical protein [Haloferacaceae archaeon]